MVGGLLLRGTVVERDDQEHGQEERHGDGNRIDPHLAEYRDGQQRGEGEGCGGHAVHDLAIGERGREDPTKDRDDHATGEAADQHALIHQLVAQVDTVQARLGHAAEQAGHEGAERGLTHIDILLAHRDDQHAGGRAEAGEVPHAHRALDEVVAQRVDVDQHEGVERPVQTERHQERVEHRNKNREDERSIVVQPSQADTEAVADPHAQRAEQERGNRDHDDHGQERHEHHLHAVRNNPFKRLVHERQHGDHEQRHEHGTGIIVELQRQTEHLSSARLGAQRGVGHAAQRALSCGKTLLVTEDAGPFCRIGQCHELRGHEGRHDGGADPAVDLELLRAVVGDHDRQEVEHALVRGLAQQQGRAFRVIGDDMAGDKHVENRDNQRRAEQHVDDRAERVRQELEEIVHPRMLAFDLGTLLGLDLSVGQFLGAVIVDFAAVNRADIRHLRQLHDLVVHRGDAATDNDLIPVTALRNGAKHAFHMVEAILVHLARVDKLEPQTGGAMRQALDIARTTDSVDDLRGS